MVTFAQMKARVLVRVIDTPAAVQAEVGRLINEAIRKLAVRHNFDVMRKRLSANTTLLTRELVAKPADWKEARQDRPWRETKEGFVDFMGWLPTEEEALKLYSAATDLTDKGAPKWVRMADATDAAGTQQIEVYPLPDGNSQWVVAPAGEYRVRVPYWAFPADLVADADTNWFTVHADRYIEFHATAAAYGLDEDELREAKFNAYAEREFADVLAADKRRKIAPMRTLAIRTSVYAPKTQRRL